MINKNDPPIIIKAKFALALYSKLIKLVVLDDIFCHSDESFLEPEGLDDLDVGFEGHKCTEELFYVVEFADVLPPNFFQDLKP